MIVEMTNGEKYKSAAERAEAFKVFCDNYLNCEGCPICKHCDGRMMGSFYWLDLEAEDEKPLPCPFCGGECDVVTARADEVAVRCLCGYDARPALCIEDAIAAHNHVARAVADAKAKEENK